MKRRFKLIDNYYYTGATGLNYEVPFGTEGNAIVEEDFDFIWIKLEVKYIYINNYYLPDYGSGSLDLTFQGKEFFEKFEEINFSDFLY